MEVFRKRERLALVVASEVGAIEDRRTFRETFKGKPSHDLAVLEEEGDLVTADLEDGLCPRTVVRAPAKAGVKKPA